MLDASQNEGTDDDELLVAALSALNDYLSATGAGRHHRPRTLETVDGVAAATSGRSGALRRAGFRLAGLGWDWRGDRRERGTEI